MLLLAPRGIGVITYSGYLCTVELQGTFGVFCVFHFCDKQHPATLLLK